MTPEEFINLSVGKPWVDRATGPASYDCWGLVAAYFKEVRGYDVPHVPGYADGSVDVNTAFTRLMDCGHVAPDADGVLFMAFRNRVAKHTGVITNGGCLHALGDPGSGGQVYFHSMQFLRRVYGQVEAYRFNNG
jgi:cell wall-associated NlpC family hydrolase